MTSHEKNQNRWREFCYDLIEAAKADILEDPYQDLIEQGLRVLNWSKPKGEMGLERNKRQRMKNKFFKDFDKYYIGIETADGKKHCIRGWYLDQRFAHKECPKGYNMYEFREDDKDEWGYIAFIEPYVWVNHSGTFVTRTKIPFGENGNKNVFEIRYGHYY